MTVRAYRGSNTSHLHYCLIRHVPDFGGDIAQLPLAFLYHYQPIAAHQSHTRRAPRQRPFFERQALGQHLLARLWPAAVISQWYLPKRGPSSATLQPTVPHALAEKPLLFLLHRRAVQLQVPPAPDLGYDRKSLGPVVPREWNRLV